LVKVFGLVPQEVIDTATPAAASHKKVFFIVERLKIIVLHQKYYYCLQKYVNLSVIAIYPIDEGIYERFIGFIRETFSSE